MFAGRKTAVTTIEVSLDRLDIIANSRILLDGYNKYYIGADHVPDQALPLQKVTRDNSQIVT